jgi:hypothetical protein
MTRFLSLKALEYSVEPEGLAAATMIILTQSREEAKDKDLQTTGLAVCRFLDSNKN